MAQSSVIFLARGGDIDGQQRQVLYLADGLARQDVIVTAAVSKAGELHEELERGGVDSRVARMSPWRSLAHLPHRHLDAWRLLRIARDRTARLVHAHDVWRAEYARFIARRLGVPYIVHVRGPLSPRDVKKHRLALADSVVAIAQRYVDDLVQCGIDPGRVALIDDAVDLSLFAPGRADPGYTKHNFGIEAPLLVGVVGRMSAFKQIGPFLRAFRRLTAEAASSTRVAIVGQWDTDAYRREVMAEVARLGLADRVHFIGRCRGDVMPQLLSSLDVLVTLSGGSIMFEAMAMGRPVVSIRSDGRHSMHTRHGHNAWCVDGSDPDVAANALAHLLAHEELRARLGQAARRWVEQNLSSTVMIARVRALYQNLTQ